MDNFPSSIVCDSDLWRFRCEGLCRIPSNYNSKWVLVGSSTVGGGSRGLDVVGGQALQPASSQSPIRLHQRRSTRNFVETLYHTVRSRASCELCYM